VWEELGRGEKVGGEEGGRGMRKEGEREDRRGKSG